MLPVIPLRMNVLFNESEQIDKARVLNEAM